MKNSQKSSLERAVKQMQVYKEKLSLSDSVCEDSMQIFRKVIENNLLEGRCLHTMYASCLYITLAKHSIPVNPEDLVDSFDEKELDNNQILRSSKYIKRELQLGVKPVNVLDVIEKYGSELELTEDTISEAKEFAKDCQENGLTSGKSPRAFAGGTLYLVGLINENISQKEVTEVIGVTEVTVRNRYKEQMRFLGLEEEVLEAKNKKNI